jgi:hypothetical protein
MTPQRSTQQSAKTKGAASSSALKFKIETKKPPPRAAVPFRFAHPRLKSGASTIESGFADAVHEGFELS